MDDESMHNDEAETPVAEKNELYRISELRPSPFSKTLTLFDVYETDEENFEPYVSPLATVGISNSSSTSETQNTTEQTAQSNTNTEQTEDNNGIQ